MSPGSGEDLHTTMLAGGTRIASDPPCKEKSNSHFAIRHEVETNLFASRQTARVELFRSSRTSSETPSYGKHKAMPHSANHLQLMDSPLIGMKEIVSIREYSFLSGTHKTFRPPSGFRNSPVLWRRRRGLHSEGNLIFDAGRLCRYQPSSPLQFFSRRPAIFLCARRMALIRRCSDMFRSRFFKCHSHFNLYGLNFPSCHGCSNYRLS
jgi:hypothetical protein